MSTYEVEIVMSEKGCFINSRTYGWWNFGDRGNQEPIKALTIKISH